MSPFPSWGHVRIVHNILFALHPHVSARALGEVYGDGAGYELSQVADTALGPDVSFVSAGRLTELAPLRGVIPIAPDLAVEVLSPSDRYVDVDEKFEMFFAAGTRAGWLVNPRRRHVEVLTPNGGRHRFVEGDILDGAPVLPEFTMPVAAIVAGVEPGSAGRA